MKTQNNNLSTEKLFLVTTVRNGIPTQCAFYNALQFSSTVMMDGLGKADDYTLFLACEKAYKHMLDTVLNIGYDFSDKNYCHANDTCMGRQHAIRPTDGEEPQWTANVDDERGHLDAGITLVQTYLAAYDPQTSGTMCKVYVDEVTEIYVSRLDNNKPLQPMELAALARYYNNDKTSADARMLLHDAFKATSPVDGVVVEDGLQREPGQDEAEYVCETEITLETLCPTLSRQIRAMLHVLCMSLTDSQWQAIAAKYSVFRSPSGKIYCARKEQRNLGRDWQLVGSINLNAFAACATPETITIRDSKTGTEKQVRQVACRILGGARGSIDLVWMA